MGMWKILDKYCKREKLEISLDPNNDFHFKVDKLLYFHNEHLKLRKKIELHNEEIIKTFRNKTSIDRVELQRLVKKQMKINNEIRVFFEACIIKVCNIIEKNNEFKNTINQLLNIRPYDRIKRSKKARVENLSEMLMHFRDACVHDRSKEISRWPQFREHNIPRGEIHLEFTCDQNTKERVFMIGEGTFKFSELEIVIKEALKN